MEAHFTYSVDSSDEADEDSTVMAASAAAECAISTTCDSSRGAECARRWWRRPARTPAARGSRQRRGRLGRWE
ncbi:expressed unknown protein [Ectocarpus siliculosus]|uniref:Uncharacterized protein n=1 Tax=Ectocarpus siliculosus TaxID=2880 RepID=D7G3W2_ECTSI|nr:expressed unknown protein [Ectocarpus siliculosus]|eukprot:CBJ33639.1 expressed unknown protein [Ectocarpus siliculosus]